jgi:hypothetical protein
LGFALRILDEEVVIAGIGGFEAISRAKKAHSAESRCSEIRLSGKKLDEVVTEANQGPLGTDLEQTGTVT